ncbi:MAG: hypothetical protein ACREFS_04525 [Acetobacteraceae bacterium]
MQLNLAFPDALDLPSPGSEGRSATVWDQIDAASRITALEILARLIARMLLVKSAGEANDE